MSFPANNSWPASVELIEVGPRDGLQREKTPISTDEKVTLIEGLVAAGCRRIQVTSFVHPRLVPQMADAEAVCARLPQRDDVVFSGLALNLRGVERAREAGLRYVDISISASDAHSRRNARRSRTEAQAEFETMVRYARRHGLVVRGGIQCAFGYRQAGDVAPATVVEIARRHLELGVDELALADSSGLANPRQVSRLLRLIQPLAGRAAAAPTPLILHLHDTRGMGLANVLAALDAGLRHFDTAFGGLGGCPFIDGAAGNIATEDTAHMLHAMGIETGLDLPRVSRLSRRFERLLGQGALPGKIYQLLAAEAELPAGAGP